MRDLYERLRDEVAAVIVGQDRAIELLFCSLLCRGHLLIEGPPGVAKTLLASTTARALGLDFARAQFTPDMLPSDLTGSLVLRGQELVFRPGPVFTNVLLADEINRTPPKTQAALLESMQEGQVTIDGQPHRLPDPFLVIATENPIEYEGTYPLPEAQLDRFLLRAELDYPSADEEREMLAMQRNGLAPRALEAVRSVADRDQLLSARSLLDTTSVSDEVAGYVVNLVRRTRQLPSVSLGASPRAAVHLLVTAKAIARLAGREYVIPDDVAGIAPAVLAHRLVLTPEAELERFTAARAVQTAIDDVPIPR